MNTKIQLWIVCLFFSFVSANAQKKLWKQTFSTQKELVNRNHIPRNYSLYEANFQTIEKELAKAPKEENSASVEEGFVMELPTIYGKTAHYYVFEVQYMEKDLAAKYPALKSYKAIRTDAPTNVVYLSLSPEFGIHLIGHLSNGTTYYLDTYTKDLNTFVAYQKSDISPNTSFQCLVNENNVTENEQPSETTTALIDDNKFRSYRLAMACTREYATFHINAAGIQNGNVQQKKQAVLAAMLVTVTRLNSIYERDVASRLILVGNNDQILFINQDNFDNDDTELLIEQSQSIITSTIGSSNFDIGHTVSTGAGGLASLGSLCINSEKASGVTGTSNPVGDPFDVDYVAHEIGHQFGANHTFHATTGFCGGFNRNLATAMEPGSGSTIMGYASLCAQNNVQMQSDAYFHWISIQEMSNKIKNASCGTIINANNPTPIVNAGAVYTIPHSTPFLLTAEASDSNNSETLTYTWEQGDQNNAPQPPVATSAQGPLFRSLPPTTSPSRSFPSYETVLAGTNSNNGVVGSTWEKLPSVARLLKFTVTVRDNNFINGGQTNAANTQVFTANTGPFVITYPNNITSTEPVVWPSASEQTITWNVAGTQANGINTQNVSIAYSIDNGATYTDLVASTPNDGSEVITVPALEQTQNQVRIKIKAVGNIFYTVSKKITINGTNASQPSFQLNQFQVFPNPTSNEVTVQFRSSSKEEIVFHLYDSNGRKVMSKKVPNSGDIHTTFSLQGYAAGVYLLMIEDGHHKVTQKIMKR